jgi:hypothetical protein
MKFLTQYYYEKTWTTASETEVLKLIQDEFPDVPAEGTFEYVRQECQKDKIVSVGECRFKQVKE